MFNPSMFSGKKIKKKKKIKCRNTLAKLERLATFFCNVLRMTFCCHQTSKMTTHGILYTYLFTVIYIFKLF